MMNTIKVIKKSCLIKSFLNTLEKSLFCNS